jgi:pimeloyl-ACP methyl ester carboxylesterase
MWQLPMNTQYATSLDCTRIAYDRQGRGPAVVLLHGGGGSRQEWEEAGYVSRLRGDFTVIALDLRGHGESDLPTDPAAYRTEKLGQDILAVADACGADRFALWGMSYGGKVGRYLAVASERVARLILIGTPMGAGVSGQLRDDAIRFCSHWPPILLARDEGQLDLTTLSPEDRDLLDQCHVPAMLGWVRAMLDWPPVEPADFRCPTLWLVGSEDRHAVASLQEYEETLKGSRVRVQVWEGLDHMGAFEQIDRVFPTMRAFTRSR